MKEDKKDEMVISEEKLENLSQKLSKTFSINEEEALEIIYEEWDMVESLFYSHNKVEIVHEHFIDEINNMYRIA